VRANHFQSIQDIVIAISGAEKQIVGLTSPERDDLVSSIAKAVALFTARSGKSVLLVKLSQPVDGNASDGTLSDLSERRNLVHRRQGLDYIALVLSPDSPYSFSDTAKIRSALDGLLNSYELIVLELGPVFANSAGTMNPLPAAAACDRLLLTCRRGMKRAVLAEVAEKMRAARCSVDGIILNDMAYLTAGAEIAQLASRLFWPVPRLRRCIQNWAMNSELLN